MADPDALEASDPLEHDAEPSAPLFETEEMDEHDVLFFRVDELERTVFELTRRLRRAESRVGLDYEEGIIYSKRGRTLSQDEQDALRQYVRAHPNKAEGVAAGVGISSPVLTRAMNGGAVSTATIAKMEAYALENPLEELRPPRIPSVASPFYDDTQRLQKLFPDLSAAEAVRVARYVKEVRRQRDREPGEDVVQVLPRWAQG